MTIKKYHGDRKKYLPPLLEADPCEEMLDRYLGNGFFLTAQADGDTAGVACIVPVENVHNGVGGWELKNISVAPRFQRQGVGSALIAAAEGCLPKGTPFWVGTADGSVAALAFYRRNGFEISHVVKGFFTDNYPEPIYDQGILCQDMVYLYKTIGE